MGDYNCPSCGYLVQDVTKMDDLTGEQMAEYQAGQWGVYACTNCGWIGDKREIEEAQRWEYMASRVLTR